MSARDWDVIYRDRVPVEMAWNPKPARRELRCPKTWPHEPHAPWFDGNARRLDDPDSAGFTCPGVPIPEGDQ